MFWPNDRAASTREQIPAASWSWTSCSHGCVCEQAAWTCMKLAQQGDKCHHSLRLQLQWIGHIAYLKWCHTAGCMDCYLASTAATQLASAHFHLVSTNQVVHSTIFVWHIRMEGVRPSLPTIAATQFIYKTLHKAGGFLGIICSGQKLHGECINACDQVAIRPCHKLVDSYKVHDHTKVTVLVEGCITAEVLIKPGLDVLYSLVNEVFALWVASDTIDVVPESNPRQVVLKSRFAGVTNWLGRTACQHWRRQVFALWP